MRGSKNYNIGVFWLVFASSVLILYGLTVLYSASQPFGQNQNLFGKQVTWLFLSILGFLFFYFINLDKLETICGIICGITIVALVLVLIPKIGTFVNGTRRWISFGPIRIQPSEPAKIGFVLFFAYYLTNYVKNVDSLIKGFIAPSAVVGCFSFLVILEPDFGTAFLFGSVGMFMLFMRGAKFKFIIPTVTLALIAFATAVYLNPIRLRRITSFLDVEANRLTGSYQLWQSLIGFGSGGLTGLGLGNGRQQHFFLPEAHTDFIFAILAEELGLIHVLIVISLFAIISYNALKIIKTTQTQFTFFLAIGATSFLIFQAFLNMAVVMGLMPTKGLALPFLSYGGSNLLTSCCLIGLLSNIAKYPQRNLIKKII